MFFYSEQDEITGSADPYFSNVSLLLKMDSDFSDSSNFQRTVTENGSISITNAVSKYGIGSGDFTVSGNSLSIQGFNFGSSDFTVETWVNKQSFGGYDPIFGLNNYTDGILLRFIPAGNKFTYWIANSGFESGDHGITLNTWNHIAFVRNGNNFLTFVNGQLFFTYNKSVDFGTNGVVHVGKSNHASGEYFRGYMDDYRITIGVARYTENFTPPDSLPTS